MRPPPPPNPPPGFYPGTNFHAILNSPSNFLGPSHATDEPEVFGSPPLSPTSQLPARGSGELSPQNLPTTPPMEPIDDRLPPTSPPEAIYESPSPTSPPASRAAIPTTSNNHSPDTANGFHTPPPTSYTPSSARPNRPTVVELPHVSLEEALEWRRERKGNGVKRPLKGWHHYRDRLKDRDHVFLIDDSYSMEQHWTRLQKVFDTVAYIVKEVDPDGFDVWFTGPGKPLRNCKKTTAPLQSIKTRRPQGTTDINDRLSQIFDDHIEALRKPHKTGLLGKLSKGVKPLSLYVLTNGIWERNCDPSNLVENFVAQLEELRKVKGKVGIQFISFGDDPVGLERMELLDSGLNVKLDIVDTEPCDGNVWKMLLGAINDSFDKIHDKHDGGENGSSSSNRMSMLRT